MVQGKALGTRITGDPNYESVLRAADLLAIASPEMLATSALVDSRYDRKFVCARANVAQALEAVRDRYCVAMAGSRRLARYDTVYFDSPELQLYHDHRRQKLPRNKVRIRHHVDRDLTFLEVKTKTARGETTKFRVPRASHALALLDADREVLLRIESLPRELEESARTVFRRLTLVSEAERVTMDFDLILARAEKTFFSADAVIVELKTKTRDSTCPLFDALSMAAGGRLSQVSVSKYCAAIALLGDEPRDPNWTPAFRML